MQSAHGVARHVSSRAQTARGGTGERRVVLAKTGEPPSSARQWKKRLCCRHHP
ncbi:MAG TPA: hypothetical protein VI585_17220 [Candidatus Binatia bacterium]